jgi:hypothetical protein
MSNAKVLNYSTSSGLIRHQTAMRSVGGSGSDYSFRHGTFTSGQSLMKNKVMLTETSTTTKTTTQHRVREIKKQLNASNNLSPLSSPQLIRSTRTKVTESNGWMNSCAKVKSSCSSGSNSVESIVPKYQIATNTSSVLSSQKRTYLNQTSSTVNKLSNKSMNIRNATADKSKNNDSHLHHMGKKTVSTATSKKLLIKPSYHPSSTSTSPTKSFSAKFPNGLPFENEFYHYRKNNRRSSVASDSTRSNNSSDEFNNNQRLSNSPYQDEFRRNPSNDALYVDFTLKPFNSHFDSSSDDDKKLNHHHQITSASSSIKTKYLLSDKNYFCEFETVKSSSGKSAISHHTLEDRLITGLTNDNKTSSTSTSKRVVYISSASFFPKCNQQQLQNKNDLANNNE